MSSTSRTTRGLHHRHTSSLSLPFAVVAALQPKRTRNRTSILALLALVSLAGFVLCSYFPITTLTEQVVLAADARQRALNASKKQYSYKQNARQPVSLSPAQELAAVASFLASLPQNVIPPSVDPAVPIDPELVLDFDTRAPSALEEVNRVVEYVWAQNPVMLYCKLHSPLSRELKSMLDKLNLRPPPFVMDVDRRDDAEVLMPLLARLTDTDELPILLIGGRSVGSMEDIRAAEESGELKRMISAAGAVIGGGGKRKKHH
ncbi:Glutaredoxin domain-containing protein [Mycena kentingensis (nom. inval.)]|nr:Glutaredoxin domain-containing protein [Mycena kentingensis (nom. inval.)]